jgi:hypothetical protein
VEITYNGFTKQWYSEYKHIKIHDYFSIMLNQFPILVVRKLDNPHSGNEYMDSVFSIGIFGLTWTIK